MRSYSNRQAALQLWLSLAYAAIHTVADSAHVMCRCSAAGVPDLMLLNQQHRF
jgi:hypothetical protein